jgi:hypothetical protein
MGRLNGLRQRIAAAGLAAMFVSFAAPAADASAIAASARNYSVNDRDAIGFKGFGYAGCRAEAVNGGDYMRWSMTLDNKSPYYVRFGALVVYGNGVQETRFPVGAGILRPRNRVRFGGTLAPAVPHPNRLLCTFFTRPKVIAEREALGLARPTFQKVSEPTLPPTPTPCPISDRYAALLELVKTDPRETRDAAHPNPQNVVSVLVDVDERGTPTAAKVQFADPVRGDAAVETALKSRYAPAVMGCRAVPNRIEIHVPFYGPWGG